MSSFDWVSLQSACRKAHDRSPPLTFPEIRETFCQHFPEVSRALDEYLEHLVGVELECGAEGGGGDVAEANSNAEVETRIILNVRRALRFSILCQSLGGSNEAIRSNLQEAAVRHKLHIPLARLISSKGTESKSRLMASRLLSNLVAANRIAAETVTSDIALSESDSASARSLLVAMNLSEKTKNCDAEAKPELNWVDMVSAAANAGEREALGAIVAALYNAIVVMQQANTASELIASVATDKALVCNLLRHILPAKVIKPMDDNHEPGDMADDATEWISLLVLKVVSYGFVEEIYLATGVIPSQGTPQVAALVTPEQIVLLHCISRSLEDWVRAPLDLVQGHICPFGGAALGHQGVIASCRFLSEQASILRQSTVDGKELLEAEAYPGEIDCRLSAYVCILEILSTVVSCDDNEKTEHHSFCRLFLGSQTSVLSDTLLDLGRLVDKLSVESHGVKARDLKINEGDQRLAVAFVRLLGNTCYKCQFCQDLVRETKVAIPTDTSKEATQAKRSGLHVLLSCTSFSYGCFTLREWALVAIRNVLDGNQLNQEVVAKLEAQKVVDTPDLQNMGLRTTIDDRGQVRVELR